MNNLKSYTEYAVNTPTTDFVIGFDFNYGTDAVNVTVDGVPATEAGYSVIYLNSTTMRLSPTVPTGVVRLQRETDIDVPDNQFTAGAKFIASNMDENFTQIRHAQQEVRDGFSKLSDDTYEIIDTLQVVGQAAQDAADAAEQAAQTANDAAAQVNDKVSYQDLDNAVEDAVAPVRDYVALPLVDGKSYALYERVQLENGDVLKNTIPNNTKNPNVDMGGWDLASIRRVRTPEQYGADGTPEKDTAAWVRMCSDLQDGEEIRASGIYNISGSVVKISNKRGFRLNISGARFYQQSKFSRTITIEDCTKFTVKYGEFWGRGGADGEYNGASVSHNGVAGIYLNRCDYPLIIGNHLYDHAGGSIVWRETNNLMVLNNTVKGIGSTYIAAGGNGQDFAIGGYTNDRTRRDFVATISGNTISGTAFGIFATSCKSLIINANTIDSIAGQHGVYLIECDGVSACGNTIQNCHLSAFKLQIENYAGQMGLAEPKLHLHGFSYTGNIIRNCLDGLAIISTSLSDGTDQKVFGVVVSGNTIESVTQDGMVLNHCVDANIGVNTINGATRCGINFRNSSGSFSDVTILKTNSSGIYLSAYDDISLKNITLVDVGLNNTAGSGFDTPIYSEFTVLPLPSQKSNPKISLDNVGIKFTNGDAASTNLMFFSDTRTKIEIKSTRTNSLKPVRISGELVYCEDNDFYGFSAGSQTNPTTFIAGHGRREFHGSQNPQTALSTKAFTKGDICWNTNTTTGQYIGWVCLNSGSPGGWQGFGAVGVTQMPAISNSTATDVAGVNIVLNQLLAALKSSRLMLN